MLRFALPSDGKKISSIRMAAELFSVLSWRRFRLGAKSDDNMSASDPGSKMVVVQRDEGRCLDLDLINLHPLASACRNHVHGRGF
jgi:hypothetical protein